MKKLLVYLTLLLPLLSFSQTTPSDDENYILQTVFQIPFNQDYIENTLPNTANENDLKIESIVYYDGLGRSKQNIALRAGGNKEDIITPVFYDALSRQPKNYLPLPLALNEGGFYENSTGLTIKHDLIAYYKAKFPNDFFQGTGLYPDGWDNPFSQKSFESSPLNRVLEQAAPGFDWKLDASSNTDHTIKFDFQTNSNNEVKRFYVTFDSGPEDPLLGYNSNNAFYPMNHLYKSVVKDENWQTGDGNNHTTQEFKNKLGQLILKRNFNNGVEHDTHYVYDKYGNLTYVIPPKATNLIINANGNIDSDILDDLCYQYKYDHRNRLTHKKIPGKDWEYILYDQLNRPVLTQDQNLRDDNKWLFTKYDDLGRVVYTGIFTENIESRSQIETILRTATAISETRVSPNATNIGGTHVYYTNWAYPTTNLEVLTINYYDSYIGYSNIVTLPTSVLGVLTTENSQVATTTQGLPTVSKVRTLGTNFWTTTLSAYDHKARAIYIESYNGYLDARDVLKTKLDDFTGRVLESETQHSKTGFTTITTLDLFSYDHMGRLISQLQQVDEEPTQLIALNKYDELGQLIEKKVGGELWENGYRDLVEVTVTDGVINKDSSSDSWNAGILTIGNIEGDGGVSFTVEHYGDNFIVGLNDSDDEDLGFEEINYAFHIRLYGQNDIPLVFVRIDNTYPPLNEFTPLPYQVGDDFAIEREGTTLYFKHNGVTVYTYTIAGNNQRLYGDASFKSPTSSISNLDFYATNITKHLQKVDYKYNIRGWLTDINDVGDVQGFGLDLGDLFRFRISYNNIEGDLGDSGRADPLYNGNIAQTIWKTSNDYVLRGYDYKYDHLNRITDAKNRKGGSLNVAANSSVWDINYDKNGNIQALTRNGDDGNGNASMWDELTYNYFENGNSNKLKGVVDNSNSSLNNEGFKDDPSNSNDDYLYDYNGNLTKDDNKNITDIDYNHLNLPTKVTLVIDNETSTIDYVYDATGVKQSKTVVDYTGGAITPETTITQYAGNYMYQQVGSLANTLQFFNHPEGYITPVVGTSGSVGKYNKNTGQTTYSAFSYVFQYKDHLGNVRLSYSDNNLNGVIEYVSEIIEESNYYPFGLKQKGYNNVIAGGNSLAQAFKFGGKELDESLGLNTYDFGARNYDAALGRWMNIDPLASDFQEWSPYNYALNNPVYFIDPDGQAPIPPVGINGGFSVTNKSNQSIVIFGNNRVTTKPSGLMNNSSKDGSTVKITLEPGQRFESTFSTTTDDNGTETKTFDGNIIDVKTGDVVSKDVGIFDVDGIDIQSEQTFEDSDGNLKTEENTKDVPGLSGEIKLGSPIADGLAQKLFNADPNPNDMNDGNVNINNNKNGNLTVTTSGDKANQPNISYGEKKEEKK